MNYILLDIDGCIVNPNNRWNLYQQSRVTYAEYIELARTDTPITPGLVLYHSLLAGQRKNRRCVFVTARTEDQRSMTNWQLKALLGDHKCALYMRHVGAPYGSDTKLKIITESGIGPSDVILAVDDDPMMLEAYESVGISTLRATFL